MAGTGRDALVEARSKFSNLRNSSHSEIRSGKNKLFLFPRFSSLLRVQFFKLKL